MVNLIAIALPASRRFAEAIERIWEQGDAFCVLDPRLPQKEAKLTLEALGANYVLDDHGLSTLVASARPLTPLLKDDALVIATSGSGGEPRAVIHTRSSIAASAQATSSALDVEATTDKWLACLPLSHIGGLSVVLRSLHSNTKIEFHDGFEPTAVKRAAEEGATLVSLVTRTLHQIDAGAFRSILIGGAAPPAVRPDNVIATYGMTETGSGVVYDRTPLDGVEINLASDGEILLRGPMLFRGYRSGTRASRPNQAADRWTGSWFRSGDIGAWGEAGELVVEGRSDDVITSGGEKVWPNRTEAALRLLPTISDVVVLAEPDSEWGQRVVAVVTLTGPKKPTLEEVREHVKSTLPPWYAPKKLVIRKTFPRTPLGKIQRQRISLEE